MANLLVSNAVSEFQRAYPQVSDADALAIFKPVYIEVLARCQVEGGTEDKSLTDGTREYELTYDPQILRMSVVYYITAANTQVKLKPVSTDWMDRNVSGWRTTTDTGTPDKYYVDAPTSSSLTTQGKVVIGLDPIPDTTTGATYPFVRIFGTEYEEPSSTTDIPMAFPNVRVFVAGMKRNYASDRDTTEAYLRFRDEFEYELTNAQSVISNLDGGDNPRVEPTWMTTQPVY